MRSQNLAATQEANMDIFGFFLLLGAASVICVAIILPGKDSQPERYLVELISHSRVHAT